MNEQVTSVAVSIASRLSSGDSLRAGAQPAGTRVENLVQAFLQLVTAHAGQQWRLVDYARALHVTLGHLRTSCARVAGLSPTKLIHECVMREAKRRLASTRQPVSVIAQDMGFDDAAYFSGSSTRNAAFRPSSTDCHPCRSWNWQNWTGATRSVNPTQCHPKLT